LPDIAMCQNHKCKKAKECYRYMAIPSKRQFYVEFQNICEGCNYKHFWDAKGKQNLRREELPSG